MSKYDGKKLLLTVIMTEEKVAELYKGLAEKVNDESAKRLFLNLSKDEEKHKNMYKNILAKLPNDGQVEISDDEIEYTNLLIDSNIFVNEKVRSKYMRSDALILASKVESDSIIFYSQLIRLFPDTAKDELEIILKEEKKHLKKVNDSQFLEILPSLGL